MVHEEADPLSSDSSTYLRTLIELLDAYDSLTLDLVLEDPVILESTVQLLVENTQIILAKINGESSIDSLLNNGFEKELRILVQLLCLIYKRNDGVKVITLKLLMDLTLSKPSSLMNHKSIITHFINTLLKYNPLLSTHLEEVVEESFSELNQVTREVNSISYLTHYKFFKFIMMCALLSRIPLLASSLYITLVNSYQIADSNFISYLLLNNEILRSTVNSLLVFDPRSQLPNLITVIRLYEFQNEKLDELSSAWRNKGNVDLDQFKFKFTISQQNDLLAIVLTLSDESHLALKIYVFEKILDLKDDNLNGEPDRLALYLRYAYKLIESNINLNNDPTVYFIWSKIDKYHTRLYNSQINSVNNNAGNNYYYYSILGKVVRFFSKNHRYNQLVNKLIKNIPIHSCKINPDLMDALLTHATRNEDISLSNILIQQLGEETSPSSSHKNSTQLTRGQLSALLGLHLKFHDSEGAEKIVNLIYQRFDSGLDHTEMNMICKQMLSRVEGAAELFGKVWQMFQSLDLYLGKSLATLIIDHMIENRKMDFEIIDVIYSKLIINLNSNDEIWEWISGLYIKYLTRAFPLKHAKTVYQNSIRSPTFYNRLNNPFLRPFDKARIYLPLRLRRLVLKSIIDSSIFHKHDQRITFWCLEEFEKLGYGFKEILLDLSMSKKDLDLKQKIDLNLLKFSNDESDPFPLANSSGEEKELSTYFDSELKDLYSGYLKHRRTKLG